MSLFGTTPPDEGPINPSMYSSFARSRHGLFDDDGVSRANSDSLFNEDDDSRPGTGNPDSHRTESATSPWDLPTPRKKKTRAELLRALLPSSDVPDYYIDAFDTSLKEDEESAASTGALSGHGVARVLAAAKLDADSQTTIMGVLAPGNTDGAAGLSLGRNEFNVLLALIGLAQEGDVPSLDGVDERRRSEFLFRCLILLFVYIPPSIVQPHLFLLLFRFLFLISFVVLNLHLPLSYHRCRSYESKRYARFGGSQLGQFAWSRFGLDACPARD